MLTVLVGTCVCNSFTPSLLFLYVLCNSADDIEHLTHHLFVTILVGKRRYMLLWYTHYMCLVVRFGVMKCEYIRIFIHYAQVLRVRYRRIAIKVGASVGHTVRILSHKKLHVLWWGPGVHNHAEDDVEHEVEGVCVYKPAADA